MVFQLGKVKLPNSLDLFLLQKSRGETPEKLRFLEIERKYEGKVISRRNTGKSRFLEIKRKYEGKNC
jgi:hypothetical protein